jgi:DNA end-binding protein Ku
MRRPKTIGVGYASLLEGLSQTGPSLLSDCAPLPPARVPSASPSRQINKATGNRLRQQLIDEETHEPVAPEHKGRGYEVAKGQYLIVEDAELDAIEIESTHTIEIDRFVPRSAIDQRFFDSPYYVMPSAPVGQEAFAVIREAMRGKGMVALGRLVLSKRERVIALEPYDKGLLGTTLRYPYEVRKAKDYFCDLPDLTIAPDMLTLAEHILDSKASEFDPATFRDRYEEALLAHLKAKQAGAVPERRKIFEGGQMDEQTLLAVAEVVKAEVGVSPHRIINPAKMASLAWPSPNARSSIRQRARRPRRERQGGHHELAPHNESEAFLCHDADQIHLRMVRCTRRTFLGGLASSGAGALFADQSASAEAAVDKPFRIDVHHHLSSPGFIAEISGRRTGQVPSMKWTVAQSIDDMDQGGVATAILSISEPSVFWQFRRRAKARPRDQRVRRQGHCRPSWQVRHVRDRAASGC